jgi:hypothetical protein
MSASRTTIRRLSRHSGSKEAALANKHLFAQVMVTQQATLWHDGNHSSRWTHLMPRLPNPTNSLPPFSPENPGQGSTFLVDYSEGERHWSEEVDTVEALAMSLKARGIAFERSQQWLTIEGGLIVRPQFVQVRPRDDDSVQSTTTIEINHETLCPAGTFEYQHATGETVDESLESGFGTWADTDLPVLREALSGQFERCMVMSMSFEKRSSVPARTRQLILGPPTRANAKSARTSKPKKFSAEEHEFCPCCLLTRNLDAFSPLLEGDDFFALRLYAMRNSQGAAEADCRVNGVDWPAGTEALIKYVETWPGRGFEFRKQYVAIRTVASE